MRLGLLILLMLFFFCPEGRAQTKILAQVNDDIISDLDFQQRLQFIQLTGQADTKRKEIRERILKQLIDEKLKQQEASEAGIEVADDEIEHALKITLRQNGLEYDSVMRQLKENNLPVSVISDQIKSDLMFIRAIKKNAGAHGEISDREIEAKLAEIQKMSDQKQYLVSEILLPVDDANDDSAVYGQAMKLIMRLQNGEEFAELAAEYSKAPSAVKGGMAGWIAEGNLSGEMKEEFSVLSPGQISTPVKTADGYKIFVLNAIRDPEELREASEEIHLIQLFLPENFPEKQKKAVLRDLNMTKGSCTQFKSIAEQLKTSPRTDLGKIPVNNLPPPILSVLNRTPLLEPSVPLPIEGGSLVLMACSREKTSLLPDKEEIKMQMEGEKLEVLAQRRLKELRRTAVTEIRR